MQSEQTSFLFGANAPFIEELYARFLEDPAHVDADWRTFFEALAEERGDVLAEVRGASWAPNKGRVIDVPDTDMRLVLQLVSCQEVTAVESYKCGVKPLLGADPVDERRAEAMTEDYVARILRAKTDETACA